MKLQRALSPLCSLLVAACAVEAAPAVATDPVSKFDDCPWWGCGGNTPVIDLWGFHDLDLDGAPNQAGIRLLAMVKNQARYLPEFDGARLLARPARGSGPPLEHAALEGAAFVLETPGGIVYLQIRHVSNLTPYWVGEPDLNETYELTYGADLASDRPVCANPPNPESPDEEWPAATEALLFAGDRYDAQTKRVTAIDAAAGRWFNIACAGSALAKLHLTRHTTAGSQSTFKSTQAERQAVLKMYTSDVCGTGRAFTRAGEPLHWSNRGRWLELTGTEASSEALWTETGALCLDEHRLEADPGFPGIRDAIVEECAQVGIALEPCDDLLDHWEERALVISANP
jgi:hypothetical protein